jgi:trigger factor
VLEEVINDAVPKAYETAIREQEIVPVGRPEVDVTEIEDGQHVTFTAEIDVRPDFELPDYKAITVQVEPATATEEAIDEHIDNLRTRFASLKDVERVCQDGDLVLVDLSGATDTGDEVEDLSGNALSYEIGTDGMLPGFDEAMRGAAAGETRTFPFTPSNGDWAGVPLTVTATITAVRERELPELDEEFVTMASEFDTVEELREDAKTRVERLKRMEQGQQARERVHESLMEAVEVPVPEGIIAAEVDAHFEDGHEASDEHRSEVEQQAREALKSQFILDKIAETEEVTVGESELSNWLMQQAPRYGMAPDALAQALVESGQVQMALSDIRRSKALAVVLESASVTDTDGTTIDLAALEAELNEAMQAAQMAQMQAQMAAAQSDEQSDEQQ